MKTIDPRSRTRNKQVRRIIRLFALLHRGYWTPEGLAAELGVSVRTVHRDMAAIRYEGPKLKHDGVRTAWRPA